MTRGGQIARWGARARELKRDVVALSIALRDPRVGWSARFAGAIVVAYALSPVDLIPDFVPVLGLLDDLLIVPLGIALVVRLVPPAIMAAARERARAVDRKPVSLWGLGLMIVLWALAAWWLGGLALRLLAMAG